MAAKDITYEFLWETGRQKYFLVKTKEGTFFIFRTPGKADSKAKDRTVLFEWEGEKVVWGGVPKKVRMWVKRKGLEPLGKNQKILIHK